MVRIAAFLIALAVAAPAAAQTPSMIYGTSQGLKGIALFTPKAVVDAGGGAAALSHATPLVESGSGAPGSATAASRGDHVHPAAGGSAALSNLTPKAESGGGAPGTGSVASRGDHVHPAVGSSGTATPLSDKTPLVEGTAAAGSGAAASRDDHVHPAAGGGSAALSDATPLVEFNEGGAGMAAAASRGDHVHPAYRAPLSNRTPLLEFGTGSPGGSTTVSRDDHVHPRFSSGVEFSTRRPLRDTGPGTPGISDTASRGDHVHPNTLAYSDFLPKEESGSGAPGTAEAASRRDHVHPASGAGAPFQLTPPAPPTQFGAVGTANTVAHGDHAHPPLLIVREVARGITNASTIHAAPYPTELKFNAVTLDILQKIRERPYFLAAYSGTHELICWAQIPARTTTSWMLPLQGVINGPNCEFWQDYFFIGGHTWRDATISIRATISGYQDNRLTSPLTVSLSDDRPSQVITGAAPDGGLSSDASRSDHQHQVSALTSGISTALTVLKLQVLYKSELSNVTPLRPNPRGSPGVKFGVSRNDHQHILPWPIDGRGIPDGDLGDCLTYIGDKKWDESVGWKTCGSGSAPLSDKKPVVEGVAAAGSGTAASRDDHKHPENPLSAFGAVGTSGQCAKANSTRDGLRYGDCGSPRTLSNANPKIDGTVTPGIGNQVSRSDHVHPLSGGDHTPLSDATALDLGIAAAGTAGAASRADHRHSATSFLASGTPKANAGAGSAGATTLVSRGDHVHPAIATELPAPTVAVKGDIPRVNATGDAYEVIDPHAAVLAGLPALTGHGGNFLAVNSSATGLEFRAAGGGGGGGGAGGGITWTLLGQFSPTGSVTPAVGTFAGKGNECRAAHLLAYKAFGTVILPGYGQASTNTKSEWYLGAGVSRLNKEQSMVLGCTENGDAVLTVKSIPGNTSNWLGSRSIYAGIVSGATGAATIPAPTAAGAGKFLQVNGAGAAYQLVDPGIDTLIDEVGDLDAATQDLYINPPNTPPMWANNVGTTNARIGFKPGAGTDLTGVATQANLIARPGGGWPQGYIFMALRDGQDRANYRIDIADHPIAYYENGNVWESFTPSAGATASFTYYKLRGAAPANPGDYPDRISKWTLQHYSGSNHIGLTEFRGDPAKVERWAIIGDSAKIPAAKLPTTDLPSPTDKGGQYLKANNAGDGYVLSDTRVTEIEDTLNHIDAPAGATTPKIGDLWTVTACQGSGDARACEGEWKTPDAPKLRPELVRLYLNAAVSGRQVSFAPTAAFGHGPIVGDLWQAVILKFAFGAHLFECRIGLTGGFTVTNAAPVNAYGVLAGTSSVVRCSMQVPITGNITIGWDSATSFITAAKVAVWGERWVQ